MPSGIYKLTFSDGSFYIGKSISISNRWKQHHDKFLKGKAASNMQEAYNKYGAPNGEIVFQCHKDHIDIAEEMLINRLKPPLNGTYPEDPFKGHSIEEIQEISELLNMSTIDHVHEIKVLSKLKEHLLRELEDRELKIAELSKTIKQLSHIRTREELDKDISSRILHLTMENSILTNKLKYFHQPWWKRWFT